MSAVSDQLALERYLLECREPADGHVCATIDGDFDRHRHCNQCGSAVMIQKADYEGGFDIADGAEGAVCSECRGVCCGAHVARDGDRPRCVSCALKAAQEADELFRTVSRAATELRNFLGRYRLERDELRKREAVAALQAVEDAIAAIGREIFPNSSRGAA